MYDFIIIGGGIAGLYSAYKLKTHVPGLKFCILEKEGRIGGRMGSEDFHGVSIAMGAGVGRKKDILLYNLLRELKIKWKEYDYRSRDLNPKPVSVMQTIHKLRSEWNKNPREASGKTFRQYAIQKLGKETYDSFTISAGYTDYENEDVYETLYHYGMEDNEPGWSLLSIPWNDLLEALIQKIGRQHIITNTEIVDFKTAEETDDELFHLTSKDKKVWKADNVMMATTASVVQKLMPEASLYQQICEQPFLRIYAKADEKSIPVLQQYIPITTVVPGPIHKIIPISAKKGVYMIVYTDNNGAMELKKYTENNTENCRKWSRKIEECFHLEEGAVDFIDIRSYFWSCGTHYYSPLQKTEDIKNRHDFILKCQKPCPGLWVIGEMISTNQGWVEGALESVHAVL